MKRHSVDQTTVCCLHESVWITISSYTIKTQTSVINKIHVSTEKNGRNAIALFHFLCGVPAIRVWLWSDSGFSYRRRGLLGSVTGRGELIICDNMSTNTHWQKKIVFVFFRFFFLFCQLKSLNIAWKETSLHLYWQGQTIKLCELCAPLFFLSLSLNTSSVTAESIWWRSFFKNIFY